MASLEERFQQAAEDVRKLTKRPTDQELLSLYALYKQATIGDVNIDPPGVLDLKAKAKWNAWSAKKGMSQDTAKEEYITFAESLISKYSE